VRVQRVVNELPADFDTIRAEARAEGYQFLDRLAHDWASGAAHFERPGEALLAAYSKGVLAAIGGITMIRSSRRRCGCGVSSLAMDIPTSG
jgi:hypothetical protein